MQVMIPVSIYCVRLSRPVPAPPPFDAISGCLVLSKINWRKLGNAKAPLYVLHIFLSLIDSISHFGYDFL
jgi:hypothetical protein